MTRSHPLATLAVPLAALLLLTACETAPDEALVEGTPEPAAGGRHAGG
jgi:uncharacterized lipoprotein YajG